MLVEIKRAMQIPPRHHPCVLYEQTMHVCSNRPCFATFSHFRSSRRCPFVPESKTQELDNELCSLRDRALALVGPSSHVSGPYLAPLFAGKVPRRLQHLLRAACFGPSMKTRHFA